VNDGAPFGGCCPTWFEYEGEFCCAFVGLGTCRLVGCAIGVDVMEGPLEPSRGTIVLEGFDSVGNESVSSTSSSNSMVRSTIRLRQSLHMLVLVATTCAKSESGRSWLSLKTSVMEGEVVNYLTSATPSCLDQEDASIRT
jgi:hypothetical protein